MTDHLLPSQISEIVDMALSDHISFTMITQQHGVTPDQVKGIMRSNLKPGSYNTPNSKSPAASTGSARIIRHVS